LTPLPGARSAGAPTHLKRAVDTSTFELYSG
jgi:hypothetical protein